MFSIFSGGDGLSADDAARLRRVERKLDLILKHLGLDAGDLAAASDAVRAHADRGDKIAAIKQHREETGAGLAEAKDAVDAYLRSRR
jgi:ribosomal protein L7/L12